MYTILSQFISWDLTIWQVKSHTVQLQLYAVYFYQVLLPLKDTLDRLWWDWYIKIRIMSWFLFPCGRHALHTNGPVVVLNNLVSLCLPVLLLSCIRYRLSNSSERAKSLLAKLLFNSILGEPILNQNVRLSAAVGFVQSEQLRHLTGIIQLVYLMEWGGDRSMHAHVPALHTTSIIHPPVSQ